MKIVNLKKIPPPFSERIVEAKEAVVDSLLNMTWGLCSGSGAPGEFVYGAKPSQRFVSGFLLPRFDEKGDKDETSEIHMSAHGLDFQIARGASAEAQIDVQLSIYLRVLPTWEDLTRSGADLMPHPPLRKDLQVAVTDAAKGRLRVEYAQLPKEKNQRDAYRALQQLIYKEELAKFGVRISTGAVVAETPASSTQSETNEPQELPEDEDESNGLGTQTGHLEFDNDASAEAVDIPQKWMRLQVAIAPYLFDLSAAPNAPDPNNEWSRQIVTAITGAVRDWLDSDAGALWGFRVADVRPSNVRSSEAWSQFLEVLRQQKPKLGDSLPQLDNVSLTIQATPDLRDLERSNVRILLENNGKDVSKRLRDRYENVVHQVRLNVSLPTSVHRRLRLDRIEPSYRFRQFLTYAAIGVNCGVRESAVGSLCQLTTTWMPRYTQPRVVPTEIPGFPIEFEVLSENSFDPRRLTPLIQAYGDWIGTQRNTVDPTDGTENSDAADRETRQFSEDIRAYEAEAKRVALGIELLVHSQQAFADDPNSVESVPFRAWLMLNETFLNAGQARGIKGWRLFQLGFVLAHVPTLASRMAVYATDRWFDHQFDEETATLLYFPTGGGKSEAFFGLLIFNLFLDRLRGKLVGVTALVRYPLRLLTLQQAQRLHSLIIRAELIRVRKRIVGRPFEIGFWVGSANTPNQSGDSRLSAVPIVPRANAETNDDQSREYAEANTGFNKIPQCAICRGATALRRIQLSTAVETIIVCQNQLCEWNIETDGRPLPFLIVDQDIYRHAPAVLLGVIDKLALIGQHPATINRLVGMFGLARWQETGSGALVVPTSKMLKDGPEAHGCETIAPAYEDGKELFVDPFPSLVIQDEAHLLDESLGTFAGLFETTLEQLFARLARLLGGRVARDSGDSRKPRLAKIIAATATVSVPRHQFGALYQRGFMQFPYPGTSIYRSFYSEPEPPSPARQGLGRGAANAPELESPWMRVYASLMTNGRSHTVTTVAVLSAYHVLISEVWEDLQDESKRAACVGRLIENLSVEDPLQLIHRTALEDVFSGNLEALLSIIDLMRISLTYVTNKKGGDQVIEAFGEEVAKVHRRHGRDFVRLRTQLISGGVDVAEIQKIMAEAEAGAQEGDTLPLLSDCLRSIVATSAISHGVDVDKFNAMFFAGMPNTLPSSYRLLLVAAVPMSGSVFLSRLPRRDEIDTSLRLTTSSTGSWSG